MRSITVATGSRADYGLLRPLLRCLTDAPEIELRLVVTGAHLDPESGYTLDLIEQDGFAPAHRVSSKLPAHTPPQVIDSIAATMVGFAEYYARLGPDLLLVLGDRFEIYAAALAALPFAIPVAHVNGGETTVGAIDEAFRHSLTKLSHLHFVSCEEYARRVRQLGEEPWRVTVVGALSLDNIVSMPLLTRAELSRRLHVELPERFLLCTYHPVTLELAQTEHHVIELMHALDAVGVAVLFTAPNADPGSNTILAHIQSYLDTHADALYLPHLGTDAYVSAMSLAAAVVGNSSSGIVEATPVHAAVVNIGRRQEGRVRAENIIDAPDAREAIAAAILRAISAEFAPIAARAVSPFGAGDAAPRIATILTDVPLDRRLIIKHFHDL
ncbi:MAG: UDP-N-acetylglucosamine 2-epimerase [Solirubrobacteraceae bacterium]